MKYYIFYPSNVYGGAELLLFSTARNMRSQNLNVVCLDVLNGVISSQIKNNNIDIPVQEVKKYQPISLDTDSVLITPANMVFDLQYWIKLKGKARAHFWVMHPNNLFIHNPLARNGIRAKGLFDVFFKCITFFDRMMIRELLKKLNTNNAISYVDKECLDSISKTNSVSLKGIFSPVFNKNYHSDLLKNKSLKENIEVCFFSRLSDFKIEPIKKIIADICNSKHLSKILVTIIGDGPKREELEIYVKSCGLDAKFLGHVPIDMAQKYLAENCDILFAMGTASLDGACCKIPVISIDGSYDIYPKNYKYIWLYERDGYSVGKIISNKKYEPYAIGRGFDEVIDNVVNDSVIISERCFKYWEESHSEINSFNFLVNNVNGTRLGISELNTYTFPYRKIVNFFMRGFRV